MRTGFFSILLLAIKGLTVTCSCEAQGPPPVPPTFQDVYTTLDTDLGAFSTTLSLLWKGSRYPVVFSEDLGSADANGGPSVVTQMTGILQQIQAWKAMGVKGVMVQCGFPILYEPFYRYLNSLSSPPPGFQGLQFSQFQTFYQQVAQTVRAAGLKLIVENESILANSVSAGWGAVAGPYYATLDWTQFQHARAQNALVTAQTMQPDYLVLLEEPAAEAIQTGQTEENSPSAAAGFVSQMLTSAQQAGIPGMQLGAGVASWQPEFDQYVAAFDVLPLNFINLHIYPINNLGAPYNSNFLLNALTIVTLAKAAGKPVAISEAWMWKMRDSEWSVLSMDEIRARNPFSFWAPLDAYFLQTMVNLANYGQMLFMAPEGPDYFRTYLDYDENTANLTPPEILAEEATAANQAAQNAIFTTTAQSYYNAIVFPPNTTPPTTPGNLTATANLPTKVNLTWSASTDNIGVAGYYVLRDGVQIATTAMTLYGDPAVQGSTTYTYEVEAFDLGGNISAPAQVTIETPPPTPPTNLTGTPASPKEIDLSWSPPTGSLVIGNYLVFRGTSATALSQIMQLLGTTTSYADRSVTPGTTYYYGVEAVSDGYASAMSAIISVTSLAGPSRPKDLNGKPLAAVRMSLRWSASSGGLPLAGYHIWRGNSSSNLSQVGASSNLSYTDNGLTPDTLYYYAVQAMDIDGNLSPMSAVIAGTTPSLPTVPTNLAGTPISSKQIDLTWTASTGGSFPLYGYRIYRGSLPSNLAQVGASQTNSYTDHGLLPATVYYYAVQAVDTPGDVSALSNAILVTTLPVPTRPRNLVATPISQTQIGLTWTASTRSLPTKGYLILRGPAAGNLVPVATTADAAFTDHGLTSGTQYYYAVQAVETDGDSSPVSATVSASTQP